jgi:hypothetical protein
LTLHSTLFRGLLCRCWLLAAVFLFAPLSGCDSGPKRPPVYPVSGELFVKGQPAAGARLILHPLDNADPTQWPLGYPMAQVEADGKFHFQSYAEKDGAPAGKYKLRAQWLPGTEGDEDDNAIRVNQIADSYNDAALTPWTVEVLPKRNILQRFDIP